MYSRDEGNSINAVTVHEKVQQVLRLRGIFFYVEYDENRRL